MLLKFNFVNPNNRTKLNKTTATSEKITSEETTLDKITLEKTHYVTNNLRF